MNLVPGSPWAPCPISLSSFRNLEGPTSGTSKLWARRTWGGEKARKDGMHLVIEVNRKCNPTMSGDLNLFPPASPRDNSRSRSNWSKL